MGTPLAPYGLVCGKLFEPVCKPFRVYHVHPVTRGDSFTPVIVTVFFKVKILPELVINVKTIEHGEAEAPPLGLVRDCTTQSRGLQESPSG